MNEISRVSVFRRGSLWYVAFFGPKAERVKDLFGTTVLPTPYSDTNSPAWVLDQVSAKNPECSVQIV